MSAGLGLQLSCRQPAPAAPAGAGPEAVANRAAPPERVDRPPRPDRAGGVRAGADTRPPPQPRPLVRCFREDSAQSPPRSLSVLLAQSADRFEQGLLLANQAAAALTAASGSPAGAVGALAETTGLSAGAPGTPAEASGSPAAGAVGAMSGSPTGAAERSSAAAGPAAELSSSTAQFEAALACAEEALRVDGRSVEALHNRALALQELGQLELARDAFTRALAIEPDDPETLAGAADLYINRLPPSTELSEIGVEYAHRGSQRLRRGAPATDSAKEPAKAKARQRDPGERALLSRLFLLEAQGLNDLGRPQEALQRLDAAIAASDSVQARYERAMALLDLCRFGEARRAFNEVVQREPDDAWAHYNLGLTLEMLGQSATADKELALAQKLAPRDFPQLLPVSPEQFRLLVDKEVQGLTPEQRADLRRVSLETADLPELGDLTAEDPPLSPTILGLFRGLPLPAEPALASDAGKRPKTDGHAARAGAKSEPAPETQSRPKSRPEPAPETDCEPRAIVLYRKNLLRAVREKGELIEQIRTTLLHELGHLRGEDDAELRARGLE